MSVPVLDEVLVARKVHPPVLPDRLVHRAALVERLDAARDDLRTRLVLVSAPAGSGKSTLLASWVAARPEARTAWLQLEGTDADPATFWTYLVHALDPFVPGAAADVLPVVQATGGEADAVVPQLLRALDGVADQLTLVLDDHHLVEDVRVHEGLQRFVDLAPPDLTIVLSTRVDPPLRVARLRVRQELVEIRAADLRFDEAEAAALLDPTTALDEHDRTVLLERTEGWAAGLVLAGLSLRGRDDPGAFVERFGGSHATVAEYLAEEVLGRLDEHDLRRLLEASILDRLSGPLVDQVCGTGDGSAWLLDLARSNQLVIGLDDTGTWFRFHHLFGELLRAELGRRHPEVVAGLHARASVWFEAEGEAGPAIDHALAAQDADRAADLVTTHATSLLNAGRFVTLLGYLDALDDTVDQHLGCSVLAGWLHLSQGRWDVARHHLDRASDLVGGDVASPVVAPLAITLELTTGDVGAALSVARPVRDEGAHARSARLAMMVGGTFVTAGLPREAAEPLAIAHQLAEDEPDHFVATVTPVFEAIDALESGDRARARDAAERSIALAVEHANDHAPLAVIAHSVLGVATDDPAMARLGAQVAGTSPRNLFLGYAHVCAGDALCAAGDPDGPGHLRAARRIVDLARDPGIVGTYLDRTASRHRLDPADAGPVDLVEPLTDRELAVLRFLPSSRSQREIAAELYVSINTVKTHTKGLYRKLGATGRDEAVRRGRELGLL